MSLITLPLTSRMRWLTSTVLHSSGDFTAGILDGVLEAAGGHYDVRSGAVLFQECFRLGTVLPGPPCSSSFIENLVLSCRVMAESLTIKPCWG